MRIDYYNQPRISYIIFKMELFVLALIALAGFAYYKIWHQPRSIIRHYVKSFQQKGFTVCQVPFHPLQNKFATTIIKGIAQGDAMGFYKGDAGKCDVIVANLLLKPKLELINPGLVREYYAVDKHYEYPKEPLIKEIFTRVAGEGLIFSDGYIWKRKRNILNKAFNFDFLKSQTYNIAQCCDAAIEQTEKNGRNEGNKVSYNLLDMTVKLASGVMLQSFLGGSNKQQINGVSAGIYLKQLMEDVIRQSAKPINFLLGNRLLRWGITPSQRVMNARIKVYQDWGLSFIRRKIEQIGAQLQENQGEGVKESNVIRELMLAHRKETAEGTSEQKMHSQKEIFEEFTTFFFAGTDTTSHYTQMMIYLIARNSEVERKLRQEIQEHMSSDDYSYDNLKKFTYIDCIQKETTRMYGPVTHLFTRNAMVDNQLGGVRIHKGTAMTIMTLSNHHNPKYFRDPEQFEPERWQSECDSLPAFASGGFSAGARTCIGKHLALLENKIAIIKFFSRYSKVELGKSDFKMNFKFLYSPEHFETTMTLAA